MSNDLGSVLDLPLLIAPSVETRLNDALVANAMVGGWLLSGPPQVGKAKLAQHIAISVLSGTDRLGDHDASVKAQILNEAHPDLFILRRSINEKTGRLKSDIVVDDVRNLIGRLHRTSSTGRRVTIIDSADDLNRAAGNALLKVLEEPPAGTLMILLSSAPGKLLSTIRSRCRRLAIPPVETEPLSTWLKNIANCTPEVAQDLASIAAGRPGRAFELAQGEGQRARELVDLLLNEAAKNGDLEKTAQTISAKDADDAWDDFQTLLIDQIAINLTQKGKGAPSEGPLANVDLPQLFDLYDHTKTVLERATALNSDRTHTVLAVGLELRDAIRGQNARR